MKKLSPLRILAMLLIIPIQLFSQWVKKGNDINGAAADNLSGSAVSINGDGTTVLIGSPGNGVVASYEGSGRVFLWNGTTWQQMGAAIFGEYPIDQFGYSVSINEAGTIIALGAIGNSGNGMYSGHVRVYEWDGIAWIQLGADIDGSEPGEGSGHVSLNAAGNIIAIGAPHSDGNGVSSGQVRVYEWSSGNWIQKGNDMEGEATEDISGQCVSLNNTGDVVAIGAPWNDGNGFMAGHVRIYEWNGSAWIQKGNDIDGEDPGDGTGFSVSLSGNGNTVAIGDPGNSDAASYAGQARIFDFNGTDWVQKGGDIYGYAANDYSGSSISLSDGGDTVAIGAWEDSGWPIGFVHIFSWNGSSWIQVGNKITANCCGVASSIGLNNRGNVVAIGAYLTGNADGQVTVWEDITVGVSEIGNKNQVNCFHQEILFRTNINNNYIC